MKKIIISLAFGLASVNSWSICAYNLDATQADLQSQLSERFPSVTGSEVSYSTTLTNKIYSAMSKSIYNNLVTSAGDFNTLNGDKELATNGIQAFEFKFKLPQILDNKTMLNIFPIIAGGKMLNGENINFMISYQKLGSVNSFYLTLTSPNNVGQTTTLPIQTTSDGYQYLGIYLNQNSNQIGVIFNGVNKGYIDNYPSKLKNIFFTINSNYTDMTNQDVGKNVEIKLITDSSQISQSYPTSTTDICGINI